MNREHTKRDRYPRVALDDAAPCCQNSAYFVRPQYRVIWSKTDYACLRNRKSPKVGSVREIETLSVLCEVKRKDLPSSEWGIKEKLFSQECSWQIKRLSCLWDVKLQKLSPEHEKVNESDVDATTKTKQLRYYTRGAAAAHDDDELYFRVLAQRHIGKREVEEKGICKVTNAT